VRSRQGVACRTDAYSGIPNHTRELAEPVDGDGIRGSARSTPPMLIAFSITPHTSSLVIALRTRRCSRSRIYPADR
jgi:hypothetical protein